MTSKSKNPRTVIEKLCKERYSDAKAVFWAGSVSQGTYTGLSDLDIVVVFEALPNAYREAFAYEGWKVDAFIHDMDTLRYFFEKVDKTSGILALPKMVLDGTIITPVSAFSEEIKNLARTTLEAGPPKWNQADIDKERFFITDKLDDILSPQNRAEQMASSAWLYEALAQFYFRAQGKWCASGKSILRYLKNHDYDLACAYRDAFEELFKRSHTHELETLVNKILEPYGGLLWEGYRSDAPKEYKATVHSYDDITIIPATLADYQILQNMGRFYVYDMSEYMSKENGWEIPEDGLYECLDFKKYFDQQESYPFIIRKGKELAGFVIIDKKGSDESIDFNMAQFFILRKFKHEGIGRYVAQTCFDKFKGVWELMVLPGNTGAYQFWKRSIQDYTGGKFTEYTRNVAHLSNSEKNIFKFESKE